MTIEELYRIYKTYPSVKTDTRKLKQGDIFFALKGPNFNGNLFAVQALQQGAAYSVIDEDINADDERLIKVDDALETLQQLAKHHRRQLNIPFIAITGSNGKTTTKELVHAVLSSHYKTYTTQGNLNNHIGVPITILNVREDAAFAVIEMGANHPKEIAGYCTYALPTHGIITNCGKAHLEGFGNEEGVRKAKGELFDFLRANKGTVFIYTDYDYLQSMSAGIENIFSYGTTNADVSGSVKTNNPFLEVAITKGSNIDIIKTKLVGEYNLPNILCAVAIGKYFNVPEEKIKTAIENYMPGNSRSQMMETGSNKIILDAYNANPSSMKLAIENFAKLDTENKILLLGAMKELGDESIAEHEWLIELIKKYQWKQVVLVGGDFKNVQHPFLYFDTSDEAREWFAKQHFENTYFLIKGSRSIMMEKIIRQEEV
ncbi:MAG TPA: UDP-N-acetylmuramoyl-tripeptide--D-alanyl-D-alanine ligase [Chitinophagaceae bacterium]|nr:UDP-N-acetylmuramoyl-tripeptide--D-alanyl-D-alanine ligase [Chitinophagaceae bacterium]